jgi:hypothetical protein
MALRLRRLRVSEAVNAASPRIVFVLVLVLRRNRLHGARKAAVSPQIVEPAASYRPHRIGRAASSAPHQLRRIGCAASAAAHRPRRISRTASAAPHQPRRISRAASAAPRRDRLLSVKDPVAGFTTFAADARIRAARPACQVHTSCHAACPSGSAGAFGASGSGNPFAAAVQPSSCFQSSTSAAGAAVTTTTRVAATHSSVES